jgi:hypothetical protein
MWTVLTSILLALHSWPWTMGLITSRGRGICVQIGTVNPRHHSVFPSLSGDDTSILKLEVWPGFTVSMWKPSKFWDKFIQGHIGWVMSYCLRCSALIQSRARSFCWIWSWTDASLPLYNTKTLAVYTCCAFVASFIAT